MFQRKNIHIQIQVYINIYIKIEENVQKMLSNVVCVFFF